MKQHKWYPSETNFLSVCKSCGIVLVGSNKETQCPPWAETKQLDTSDSSAFGLDIDTVCERLNKAHVVLTRAIASKNWGLVDIVICGLASLKEDIRK